MLRKLEKYEVLDEIGHGGMATVYRARDSSLDRLVALKVLHPHLQRTIEARARFTREAKSVAKLHHPHILEIYDYSGEASDETYIAAELLTGPTLKAFIPERKQIPPEIAACIALQLADALSEAHEKGIIHRDVKPENVLIHQDRCVKLTDFGIAHMVDTHTFTATGQILGSPGHMAPEQIESGDCDVRSDVFSLGTVLYFCATGRLPFIGRNAHHLLKLLLEGDYPDPLRLRPEIGADLAGIMKKALSRSPPNRYQSADEMAFELKAFLAEMGIDDPDALLARYFSDPAQVASQLETQALRRLLSIGAEAAKADNIPKAQAVLSRALAIDEGNERALRLLGSLGRRRRRLAVGLAAVGAIVLVLAIAGYATWRRNIEPATEAETTLESETQATDEETLAARSPEVASDDGIAPATNSTEARSSNATGGRRWVVFKPTPPNVSISVDGDPPRPYGPDFQGIRLKAGRHVFRFVGAEDCCEERVIRRQISAGSQDLELAVRLRYKPARLYLKGPAPRDASVQITLPGNRTVSGRIREILRIPMRALNASAQVKIQAPGYLTYKSVVNLRAGGDLTEHSFTLERRGKTP
ncbi:MAG: serine/threonine protein kinase [Myxococcales bacterium]|nr:serine/threonine protein kinase [Myxococcales bacterium]MDH3485063.1 serine/threonine protein kinase [Myxococcales bacterium]